MPTCPEGHHSADDRHCDVCGRPFGHSPRPAPGPPPAAVPEWECPNGHRRQTGQYCEQCGHNSLLPAPDVPPAAPGGPAAVPELLAVATTDREYFEFVCAEAGENAASLHFPPYCPERRFRLSGRQMLIGRYSASRGSDPEIDLTGPPEDPAVGRSHALLVARDGHWALVDLDSVNHTYLNDFTTAPLAPNVAVPVGDGDRIYLGAWTVLTIRAEPGA
ncbi:FHA domain-containing protein [Amycolatopsis samaneae]|uniref:FHA domain-containing protein n=1 Tax=Amycolatopsis samaneae TaxID=664691 RepID=A0ABW5GS45_9PSEU